jgi:large subunit ribosomal protein L15
LKINDLRPARGTKKKPKRVGRGVGSGHGKTCGRGAKGLLSRTGGRLRPGFEGGQMPLIRRLPKRGFTNKFKKIYQTVNLKSLNIFKEGEAVNPETLREKGLIRNGLPVKILGDGELKKKLKLEVHRSSKSASEKIKKSGGSIKLITIKKGSHA